MKTSPWQAKTGDYSKIREKLKDLLIIHIGSGLRKTGKLLLYAADKSPCVYILVINSAVDKIYIPYLVGIVRPDR